MIRWLLGPECARLTLFFAAAVFAWGKPPPDWVRPYLLAEDVAELARGQPAVMLADLGDVRFITSDRVRRVYRGAVRIMTEPGRAEARCGYGYNENTEKIRSAQAWIISRDGKNATGVSLREFADTVGQFGKFFWPQQRILSLNAADRIEVGGVLAWEFEVESQSGITEVGWTFDGRLPVGTSLFEVTPPAGGTLEWSAASELVAAPVAGALPGALRWTQRRVSGPGRDRPDGFFPTPFTVSARPVSATGRQTWADFARLAASVIEPRIVVTPEIKAKAEALVLGKTARWARVRALAEFVQRDISYLAVTLDKDYLAGYRPHPAAEVLQNRYGDCKDKATLLAAMLRALGEKSDVVLVYSGNPRGVRRDWPSTGFNHAISSMPADEGVPAGWPVVDAGELGRLVLFDPTDAQTPLGTLGEHASGGLGLVASDRATDLVAMPLATAAQNRHESRIDAALAADGTLTLKIAEIARGEPAVRLHALREELRNDRFGRMLEARLRETLPLLRDLKWTDSWAVETAEWRLTQDCSVDRHARRSGGLLLVNLQFLTMKNRLAPWKATRDGLAWLGAVSLRKEVRLALPPEAKVEELPDEWTQQADRARGQIRYRQEGGRLVCEAEFTQEGGFFDQSAYEALRLLLQKMQDAERRPLVIRATPPAAAAGK